MARIKWTMAKLLTLKTARRQSEAQKKGLAGHREKKNGTPCAARHRAGPRAPRARRRRSASRGALLHFARVARVTAPAAARRKRGGPPPGIRASARRARRAPLQMPQGPLDECQSSAHRLAVMSSPPPGSGRLRAGGPDSMPRVESRTPVADTACATPARCRLKEAMANKCCASSPWPNRRRQAPASRRCNYGREALQAPARQQADSCQPGSSLRRRRRTRA